MKRILFALFLAATPLAQACTELIAPTSLEKAMLYLGAWRPLRRGLKISSVDRALAVYAELTAVGLVHFESDNREVWIKLFAEHLERFRYANSPWAVLFDQVRNDPVALGYVREYVARYRDEIFDAYHVTKTYYERVDRVANALRFADGVSHEGGMVEAVKFSLATVGAGVGGVIVSASFFGSTVGAFAAAIPPAAYWGRRYVRHLTGPYRLARLRDKAFPIFKRLDHTLYEFEREKGPPREPLRPLADVAVGSEIITP